MNIRVITASAGSGKTTRLSQVLDEAIASGRARPEAIVATTFTNDAAAELVERARERLLASGRGHEAQQLLAARIGTVNSVCGSFVTEFAFELGLSPALRVLDEDAAQMEQDRALASIVTDEDADRLRRLASQLEHGLDWRHEVRKIIDAARSNGLAPSALAACADRSVESLDACLGPGELDGTAIDADLSAAIDLALAAVDRTVDRTKKTGDYLELLQTAQGHLARGELRWGDWAKLMREEPGARSRAVAPPVAAAAARHLAHPRLRQVLHEFTRRLFTVAARGIEAYQEHKRARGIIDFVDQEALALALLRRPEVQDALAGQLELVLVDEFQDTSPLQLAVFAELASLARESVWVGDQKQAIYGFRGTDPALMDAVIESLTGTMTDPELLQAAFDAAGAGDVETLGVSYRSRPELVAATSEIFAQAFARQGIPEERTRLRPALEVEPAGLGPIVEHWPIDLEGRINKGRLAAGVAAGIRDLFTRVPSVRDRVTGEPRVAHPGDVAVLCRTNEQCRAVADALAALGLPAIVARTGLVGTAEGKLALAGLRLWVDPRDAQAAAEIARLVHYPDDADAFVTRVLERPGIDAFRDEPAVAAVLSARTTSPDLHPLDALGAILDALDARERCAAWGNAGQRLANLDALRAHAVTYVDEAMARREAPTIVGLLRQLDELVATRDWKSSPRDHQALLDGREGVSVSTWHRAKGREWPITILFGLETLREPSAFGLQVIGDEHRFDLAEPLAGRWLRYWPYPYTTANQHGPVREAVEASSAHRRVVARSQREALRLLYVGWTRARDRLVLCAQRGKLLGGLLGTLPRLDPGLFTEPTADAAGDVTMRWAGRVVPVSIWPTTESPPLELPVVPGAVTVGRPRTDFPPARLSPSAATAVSCRVGEPVVFGPRLRLTGSPDMAELGNAIHGFLAADRLDLAAEERLDLAVGLLGRHGVAPHLAASELVDAGSRLWHWVDTFAPLRVHREWPVRERRPEGSIVNGTADLVVRCDPGLVVVDHKSFPGDMEQALARVAGYSGQLATYARALGRASGSPVTSTWIHLPMLGVIVELKVDAVERVEAGAAPFTALESS